MLVMESGYEKFKESGQDFWRDACLAWFLYGFVTLFVDLPLLAALVIFRLKTHPTFNYPWMSHSVREFWASRWNLVYSQTLRDMVYDPIAQGTLIRQESLFC